MEHVLSAVGALFLFLFVPLVLLPVLPVAGGVFSLSTALHWAPTMAFICSNIASIAFWFAVPIASSCVLCCSCSSANIIADTSPSSSAATYSCAARAASLKRECFEFTYKYWRHSSHFSVK